MEPGESRPATRSQCAPAGAIDRLLARGFVPDGQTREQTVRVPTRDSPLLGRSGGELAKLGGRQRFCLVGTDIKATVGARTLSLYRVTGSSLSGVVGIATIDTADLTRLDQLLRQLP